MSTREKDHDPHAAQRRTTLTLAWLGIVISSVAYALAIGWLAFHRGSPVVMAASSALHCVILGCMSVLVYRARRQGLPPKPMPRSARRYMTRFLPAMALYGVVLASSTYVYKHYHPVGIWAVLMALAPAIPVMLAIAALGGFLVEIEDEFARMIMTRSYVLATGLTLATCTVWGFLETYRLVPHIPAWAVFPLLAVFLGPAIGVTRWKYR